MDLSITRHLFVICLFSGLLGLFISATPVGKSLEEKFGLPFLFSLRGARNAPNEVVIFAINKISADTLGLKQQPYKWSRKLHARAVDTLTDMGVSAIGFDLFFEESRSEDDDREFARAMHDSGKVVLLQRLQRLADITDESKSATVHQIDYVSEQLIPIVPVLEKEAAALATFPLPQIPVRLDQTWLFKGESGEKATMPVAMFALFRSDLLRRTVRLIQHAIETASDRDTSFIPVKAEAQRLDLTLQMLKAQFLGDNALPVLVKSFLERTIERDSKRGGEEQGLRSMLQLFAGNDSVFINYYGPPGTITTIPYYTLIDTPTGNFPVNLKEKAIFIGLTHDAEQGEKDGFYTVFTNSQGKHVSGVEVAATIFANLIDGSTIRPINSLFAIIFIFALGTGIGTFSQTLNPATAGMLGLCLCLIYLCLAYFLFSIKYLWSPLVVPVMVQAPLTHLTVSLVKHRKVLDKKRNISKALRCYIPESLTTELEEDFSNIVNRQEEVNGICLYSDLENYTVLSEHTEHARLTDLINRYYEEMFQIVKRFSGMVLDIRGDSMLALWPSDQSGIEAVSQSCHAALTISTIFNVFDSPHRHHLPTRIGLHQGRISLGNIGALDRFQYTITGDTVNTVARIESFNKQLKTRLLVSQEIARSTDTFEFRKMGTFLFVGKKNPLTVYELLGKKGEINARDNDLTRIFAKGLEEFQEGQWAAALKSFKDCIVSYPDYGPALWYHKLSKQRMLHAATENWDGVIQLQRK